MCRDVREIYLEFSTVLVNTNYRYIMLSCHKNNSLHKRITTDTSLKISTVSGKDRRNTMLNKGLEKMRLP